MDTNKAYHCALCGVKAQAIKKKQQGAKILAGRKAASDKKRKVVNEKAAFESMLRSRGLKIKEIAPDGHCLFSAIIHQLRSCGVMCTHTQRSLRHTAADYMRKHQADFSDFLALDEKTTFDDYCRRLERTNM